MIWFVFGNARKCKKNVLHKLITIKNIPSFIPSVILQSDSLTKYPLIS